MAPPEAQEPAELRPAERALLDEMTTDEVMIYLRGQAPIRLTIPLPSGGAITGDLSQG
jgi:hypothetical protein